MSNADSHSVGSLPSTIGILTTRRTVVPTADNTEMWTAPRHRPLSAMTITRPLALFPGHLVSPFAENH